MPIQSRRISDDRKRQAAQGRLWSAGKRNVVQAEDTSSTSSEDEGSVRSAKAQQSAAPQQPKSFVDPNEDFAQATKRAALQEWLFATGQSVPAPPSKAKPADIGSPASVRSRHTVKESTAPPPTATVAPVVKHDTPSNTRDPSAVLARKPQQPSQIQQTSGVEASTAIKPQDADHDAPAVTEVEPPSVPPATEVTDEEEAAHPGRRDFLKLLDLLGKEDKKKPPVAEEQPATTAPALARPALSADVDRRASMTLEQLTEHHFDRLYKEWIDSEADVRFVAVDEWNKAEALAHLERADTMDIALMHQQLRQRNTSQQTELDRQLAHDAALTRLEAYVISDGFVRRVNQFLHKHHLMFLASKPARERGEHQHKEYDVWQSYGQLTEELIVGDLKRHIPGFQEAEFFEALFESTEEGVGSSTRQTIAGLSLEAWEVILSFLRFEHFSELMDEYINVHYGIREGGETGMGAVNALRRTSPPPTSVTTTGQVSGSESRTAPAVGAARRTTPAVGASKPKGGVSVKPR